MSHYPGCNKATCDCGGPWARLRRRWRRGFVDARVLARIALAVVAVVAIVGAVLGVLGE